MSQDIQSQDVKTQNDNTVKSPPPSPPPPHGPRLKTLIFPIVIVLLGIAIGMTWGTDIKSGFERISKSVFTEHDHADDGEAGTYYTCGMHPWVILPKPGNCPICHMKLTPLDPNKFTGEIAIDPLVTQNIGVRIEPVTTGPLERTIRTVGVLDYDETGVRDVNIKVSGWIEKLHVDYLGVAVEEGQPLFDIYSPDLFTAQEEYLLAWNNRDKISADFLPDAATGALNLLEAARTRLEYYDITQQQIADLENDGRPRKAMTLLSPHSGVVIAKHANEGMKVNSGMQVYRIADLSKIWVMVTLYEYQLPYVSLGQKAVMSLSYIPGQTFEGKVIYIYPYLEQKTRQVKVRVEFDNPTGLLKPGMYANVELKNRLADEKTLAPRAAVIDTGERQVAFVSLGGGKFEPRDVQLGVEMSNGMVEILDGLKSGEMVVTSGQFLLDSEAKIRESLAKMIKGDLASDQKVAAAKGGASVLSELPDEVAKQISQILDRYFEIGDTLAEDSIKGIDGPARDIASYVDLLVAQTIPENKHFWHKYDEVATVRGKALELIEAGDMADARLKFSDLSVALTQLIKATGVPPAYRHPVIEMHCPMYREGQGGSIWLQPEGDVRNPFFGQSMLTCADRRIALPVTGQAGNNQKQSDNKHPQTQPEDQTSSQMDIANDGHISAVNQKIVDQLLSSYLVIQQKLAQDSVDGISDQLQVIAGAATTLSQSNQQNISKIAEKFVEASAQQPGSIDDARITFKHLSDAAIELVQLAPPSITVSSRLNQAYCPMAKGAWIQNAEEVINPYYGSSMLNCGRITGPVRLLQSAKE